MMLEGANVVRVSFQNRGNIMWEILFIGLICWYLYKILNKVPVILRGCRVPIIYVMGRSGHGKSSLINALAGKQVAVTDPVRPQMPRSRPYRIKLPGLSSTLDLVDSRGIFEAATPDGAIPADTVELIKSEVKTLIPNLIVHVLVASELRASERDFKVIHEISDLCREVCGTVPPIVLALTKVDALGNPRDWPPEQYDRKASMIEGLLNYASKEVLKLGDQAPIDGARYKGLKPLNPSRAAAAIVPVCTLEKDLWNVGTLRMSLEKALPLRLIDLARIWR